MKKNGIAVFKLEREGCKVTLKTDAAGEVRMQAPPPLYAAPPPAQTASAPAPSDPGAGSPADNLKEVKSPMVGTFYSAPSPDAKPFVNVGDKVTPDTVVCIIEAMKVMNEIKAEISGTVMEICAENGKPVQFGEVLLRVK